MDKRNEGTKKNMLRPLSDLCAGAMAYGLCILIFGKIVINRESLFVAILCSVVYMLLSNGFRLYENTTFYNLDKIMALVTFLYVLVILFIFFIFYMTPSVIWNRQFILTYFLLHYILNIMNVSLVKYQYRKWILKYTPRTVLIGNKEKYKDFNYYINQSITTFQVVGFVSIEDSDDDEYLGSMKELESILINHHISQIYVMEEDQGEADYCLDLCRKMGITVNLVHRNKEVDQIHTYTSNYGIYSVLTYHLVSLNQYQLVAKRVIDIILALVGLVVFCPLMIIVAVVVKRTSPGAVIFAQQRVGYNGKRFRMYKFRSMYLNAEEQKSDLLKYNMLSDSKMFKIKDDPRVTPVGKFLRRTSLDEFPQFFNVLKGDMSMVGTRPPLEDEVRNYKTNHWLRLCIKPGITGIWQVSGRSEIIKFEQVLEMDREYIENWSLGLDIKILFRTVKVLLTQRGAY